MNMGPQLKIRLNNFTSKIYFDTFQFINLYFHFSFREIDA